MRRALLSQPSAGLRDVPASGASSDVLHEAPGEEPRLPVPLQRALEPAVPPLLVHKHDIPFLELKFCLTLGRVGNDHTMPLADHRPGLTGSRAQGGARLPGRGSHWGGRVQGAGPALWARLGGRAVCITGPGAGAGGGWGPRGQLGPQLHIQRG